MWEKEGKGDFVSPGSRRSCGSDDRDSKASTLTFREGVVAAKAAIVSLRKWRKGGVEVRVKVIAGLGVLRVTG